MQPIVRPKLSERLYLLSFLARCKKEIAKADVPVLFFSPYLTSRAAERVLLSVKDKKHFELYTLFYTMYFASVASSIRTLRRLYDSFIQLFELPYLHAKMLLLKGLFSSICSQNLTTGVTILL